MPSLSNVSTGLGDSTKSEKRVICNFHVIVLPQTNLEYENIEALQLQSAIFSIDYNKRYIFGLLHSFILICCLLLISLCNLFISIINLYKRDNYETIYQASFVEILRVSAGIFTETVFQSRIYKIYKLEIYIYIYMQS